MDDISLWTRQHRKIIDQAFLLLSEIGLGDVPAELEELALAKGATLNAQGRLCI